MSGWLESLDSLSPSCHGKISRFRRRKSDKSQDLAPARAARKGKVEDPATRRPYDLRTTVIRGILWVVQSIDLWLVSRPTEGTMKYSDRHLAGLSARPPDCVELIGAGSLGYGTGPSFG